MSGRTEDISNQYLSVKSGFPLGRYIANFPFKTSHFVKWPLWYLRCLPRSFPDKWNKDTVNIHNGITAVTFDLSCFLHPFLRKKETNKTNHSEKRFWPSICHFEESRVRAKFYILILAFAFFLYSSVTLPFVSCAFLLLSFFLNVFESSICPRLQRTQRHLVFYKGLSTFWWCS